MFLALVILFSFSVSLLGRLLAEGFLVDRVALFGSFAGLTLVENPGVAFGLRFPHTIQSVLIGAVLLLFCIVAYRERRARVPSWGYGLILGGAVANIVDRLDNRLVTDFFQAGSFPVFNIADSCITIGAGILIFTELFSRRRGLHSAS